MVPAVYISNFPVLSCVITNTGILFPTKHWTTRHIYGKVFIKNNIRRFICTQKKV